MSENIPGTGKGPGKKIAADGHEYHKSATANATVAPTNQATIDKAQGKGLSNEILQFVTIIDYEWNLKGNIDPVGICDEYGYTKVEYDALTKDPQVTAALTERGIGSHVVRDEAKDHPVAKLTPIQLIAANTILDLTDTRSDRKKLQDLGVTSRQYAAWIKDPEFNSYLRQRAEGLLGDTQHEALLALMDKVKARDTKAIELYLEITGRHVRQTNANSSGGVDPQQIITRVVEIIIEEVTDQETAMRIAERLKNLVTANNVATALTTPVGEPISVPEIAQAREMTPEVKALMDKGLGYDN